MGCHLLFRKSFCSWFDPRPGKTLSRAAEVCKRAASAATYRLQFLRKAQLSSFPTVIESLTKSQTLPKYP